MDFNVLWVENQQDTVQSQKTRLERLVKQEGFRLVVQFSASAEDAIEKLADDIYSDHVDLILMDYDLGSGMTGDLGLAEVRRKLPYRDLVFYSSQAQNLVTKVLEQGVQGIFCSTREDLPDTAKGVFATLVKKVVDIDHSRGIVMGTTSDIDHIIMDSLTAAFDGSDPEGKIKILDAVKKRLMEIRDRFEKDAALVEQVAHVTDLYDNHAAYTSVDRLQLLRKALTINALHQDQDGSLVEYVTKAIPRRNLLAHTRVQVNGFDRKLMDRQGTPYTSDDMKTLRLLLLQHHETFEAICANLKSRESLAGSPNTAGAPCQ